jgi:hypothetical protein
MLKGKIEPSEPTTEIPELLAMPLSEAEYRACASIVYYASRLQEQELNPSGGPKLRWRIEVAAAFLVAAMDHAKLSAANLAREDKLGKRAAQGRERSFSDVRSGRKARTRNRQAGPRLTLVLI